MLLVAPNVLGAPCTGSLPVAGFNWSIASDTNCNNNITNMTGAVPSSGYNVSGLSTGRNFNFSNGILITDNLFMTANSDWLCHNSTIYSQVMNRTIGYSIGTPGNLTFSFCTLWNFGNPGSSAGIDNREHIMAYNTNFFNSSGEMFKVQGGILTIANSVFANLTGSGSAPILATSSNLSVVRTKIYGNASASYSDSNTKFINSNNGYRNFNFTYNYVQDWKNGGIVFINNGKGGGQDIVNVSYNNVVSSNYLVYGNTGANDTYLYYNNWTGQGGQGGYFIRANDQNARWYLVGNRVINSSRSIYILNGKEFYFENNYVAVTDDPNHFGITYDRLSYSRDINTTCNAVKRSCVGCSEANNTYSYGIRNVYNSSINNTWYNQIQEISCYETNTTNAKGTCADFCYHEFPSSVIATYPCRNNIFEDIEGTGEGSIFFRPSMFASTKNDGNTWGNGCVNTTIIGINASKWLPGTQSVNVSSIHFEANKEPRILSKAGLINYINNSVRGLWLSYKVMDGYGEDIIFGENFSANMKVYAEDDSNFTLVNPIYLNHTNITILANGDRTPTIWVGENVTVRTFYANGTIILNLPVQWTYSGGSLSGSSFNLLNFTTNGSGTGRSEMPRFMKNSSGVYNFTITINGTADGFTGVRTYELDGNSSVNLYINNTNMPCFTPFENMVITTSGEFRLCPGTYELSDTDLNGSIVIRTNDVILDCSNSNINGSKISSSRGIYNSGGFDNITYINCNVSNYFRNIETGSGSNYNQIINSSFGNYTNKAILLGTGSNGRIINNLFYAKGNDDSILISNHNDGIISQNIFNQSNPLYFRFAIAINAPSKNWSIDNNSFINTDALRLFSRNISVSNNIFENMNVSLFANIYGENTTNLNIINNQFRNGKLLTIIDRSNNTNISNNFYYNNSASIIQGAISILDIRNSSDLYIGRNFINITDIGFYLRNINNSIIEYNNITNVLTNTDIYMTGIKLAKNVTNIYVRFNELTNIGNVGLMAGSGTNNIHILNNYFEQADSNYLITNPFNIRSDTIQGNYPSSAIRISQLFQTFTIDGDSAENLAFEEINLSYYNSKNIIIANNTFGSNIQTYLILQGAENVTEDFTNYWFKSFKYPAYFQSRMDFYNNINFDYLYATPYRSMNFSKIFLNKFGTSSTGYSTFGNYSLSQTGDNYSNMNISTNYNLSIYNLTAPYNDIRNVSDGEILATDVSEYNLTLVANQQVEIFTYTAPSVPGSSGGSGGGYTEGQGAVNGTCEYLINTFQTCYTLQSATCVPGCPASQSCSASLTCVDSNQISTITGQFSSEDNFVSKFLKSVFSFFFGDPHEGSQPLGIIDEDGEINFDPQVQSNSQQNNLRMPSLKELGLLVVIIAGAFILIQLKIAQIAFSYLKTIPWPVLLIAGLLLLWWISTLRIL